MAMHIGASSGGDHEVLVDINTTPLIDVMLVLLIMLIITIPVQLHAVNLKLPAGNPPPPVTKPSIVRLDIGGDGSLRWNGEVLAGLAVLESRFVSAAAQPDAQEFHLRPHRDAPYGAVAAVMAAAQRNGLDKLGLVGNEQFR